MLANMLAARPEIIHTGHREQSTTATTLRPTRVGDPLAQKLVVGPVRVCEAKEHMFCDGDPATHVYRVEIGHFCIYKMTPDGRRQVLDFAYPGDMIGLGAVHEHGSNAVAITKAVVRCLSMQSLYQGIESNPRLGHQLYEALARELQASRDLLFTISQRTATERVAGFLLALSRRHQRANQDPNEFVLPMSRNDIADFLGLTIETVSRTFTKLRALGIIDLTQSVLVTIVEPDGLVAVADGRRH
jgi:CRP/FNR family transcriptional regulator